MGKGHWFCEEGKNFESNVLLQTAIKGRKSALQGKRKVNGERGRGFCREHPKRQNLNDRLDESSSDTEIKK